MNVSAGSLDRPATGEHALALLVERLTARLQAGEQLDLAAVVREHPDHAERLAQMWPALAALADLSGSLRQGSGGMGLEVPAPAAPATLGDFQIVGEIGRGGMGVVYKAEQMSLRRPVAVKVLPLAGVMDPRQLQRFHNEAQAAAGLHHTNIVPVYFVGSERGVHYYAMQYIEGRDLASVIAELREQARDPMPEPTTAETVAAAGQALPPTAPAAADTRPVAGLTTEGAPRSRDYFRTVARLGIQAAEALDHAHQMGIVHRDVKPANLLLDTVGRLWVTDFGLAQIQTDTCLTMSGDLVGTLRYMSPEQALAKRVVVDHRTDIYSLGATLYESLTLRPPFDGADRQELLRQIAFDEPIRPRKVNQALPAELEIIVVKALEKRPQDRYATAQELADDLQCFLTERPIKARRPGIVDRARKWSRRHQPLVRAMFAALLLAVVALGASTIWALQMNAQTETALTQAEQARSDEERQRKEAESARAQAVAAAKAEKQATDAESIQRKRAEATRDRIWQVLDQMTSEITGESLATQKELSEEQKKLLTEVLNYYREFAAEKVDSEELRARTALAAHRVGMIEYGLGRKQESAAAFRQAQSEYEKLAADFTAVPLYRLKLAESHANLGNLLLVLGKHAGAQEAYTEALDLLKKLVADFPSVPQYRHDLAVSHDNLGNLFRDSGKRVEAQEAYTTALDMLKKLVADFPAVPQYRQGLASSNDNLGIFLCDVGKWKEGLEAYRAALDLRDKLVAEFPAVPQYRHDLANSHTNLGNLQRDLGNRAEAQEAYKAALNLRDRLVAEFPAVPEYQQDLAGSYHNLGMLLRDLGKYADALAAYRVALSLREKLVANFPTVPRHRQDLANSHTNQGILLHAWGQWPAAHVAYRAALALQQELVAAFPAVPQYRYDLAGTHRLLGILQHDMGKHADALDAHKAALDLLEKLVVEFPAVPKYRQQLAWNKNNLGMLLHDLGKSDEGLEAYTEAVALFDKLVVEFPGVAQYRQDLAQSHNNLGVLLNYLGKRSEALKEYKAALPLQEELAANFPALPRYQVGLGGGYCNIGNVYRASGKAAESLEWYAKAIATLVPVMAMEPPLAEALLFLRNAHWGRARALASLQRHAEALADWDKAVELSAPNQRLALRIDRAESLVLAGKVEQAVAEVAELTKLTIWDGRQLYNLACVYSLASSKDVAKQDEYAQRAVALLRQAIKRGFMDVAQMKKDSDLDPLRQREDFQELMAELEKSKDRPSAPH
jgi:serine/threonine protein kinase